MIINMTPHPINILDENNNEITTIPASGKLIRLKSRTERIKSIDGIPVSRTVFGDPEGLPDPKTEKFPLRCYIVSQLIKSALPDRDDLLVPAEVVRDDSGMIIGCRSLGQ